MAERCAETSFAPPRAWRSLLADSWLHPLHIARRGLRRVLSRAQAEVHGTTLDLGSGGKRYESFFPRVSRWVSLDLPSNSAAETGVSVFGSGLCLPFRDGVFDSVLCTEVLEHVPEPALLVREAARVLRPGGFLVLTTPQTWGLHEVPHDYYRYTEYGLRYLAESAGLAVVGIHPTCGVFATVGQRLSSFLFFELGGRRPLLVQGVLAVFCAAGQLVFAGLDALFRHRGDPLDHLLVARR